MIPRTLRGLKPTPLADVLAKPEDGKVVVKPRDPGEVDHLKGEGAGAAAAARVSIEASGVELRTGS